MKTDIASAALANAEAQGRPVTDAERSRARIYNEKLLTLDAGRAAEIIVDAVEHDRPRVLVGRDAQAMDLLVRAMPRRWSRLVAPYMRRMLRTSQTPLTLNVADPLTLNCRASARPPAPRRFERRSR